MMLLLLYKSYKHVVACLTCILFHGPNKITLSVCLFYFPLSWKYEPVDRSRFLLLISGRDLRKRKGNVAFSVGSMIHTATLRWLTWEREDSATMNWNRWMRDGRVFVVRFPVRVFKSLVYAFQRDAYQKIHNTLMVHNVR